MTPADLDFFEVDADGPVFFDAGFAAAAAAAFFLAEAAMAALVRAALAEAVKRAFAATPAELEPDDACAVLLLVDLRRVLAVRALLLLLLLAEATEVLRLEPTAFALPWHVEAVHPLYGQT